MPYRLNIKDSDKVIGTISDEQLDELVELLVEEDTEDTDYYIDKDVLTFMEEEGADPALIALLRPFVTDEEGVEVEWKKEKEKAKVE